MLTVRRAGIKDMETVVDLRVAFLQEEAPPAPDSEPVNADYIRQYAAGKVPSGEFAVWLAQEDGRIVGIGGPVFFHKPPGFICNTDLNAMIFNMYTLPKCRRRGIATMILQHMTEYVKTTPARRIVLYATDLGRPVYERFGFSPSSNYMTMHL